MIDNEVFEMTLQSIDTLLSSIQTTLELPDSIEHPAVASFRDRVVQWRSCVAEASTSMDASTTAFTESIAVPVLSRLVDDLSRFHGSNGHVVGFLKEPSTADIVAGLDVFFTNTTRAQLAIAKAVARQREQRDKSSIAQVVDALPLVKEAIASRDSLAAAAEQAQARLAEIGSIEPRVKAAEDALAAALTGANALRDELSQLLGSMKTHRDGAAAHVESLERDHARLSTALTTLEESSKQALADFVSKRDAEIEAAARARTANEDAVRTSLGEFATAKTTLELEADTKRKAEETANEQARVDLGRKVDGILSGFDQERQKRFSAFKGECDGVFAEVQEREQELVERIGQTFEDVSKRTASKEEAFDALITNWKAEATKAVDQLNKAKEDLNRQGLAGAYHERVKGLRGVIANYNKAFGLIIAAFVGVSTWRLYAFSTAPADTSLWLHIALSAPLTAAFVWGGWICVSRVNVFNRVIEDYEFKAATAMAFEAYKREVQDADDKLKGELIRRAINNFGLSPTRLMPAPKSQHATPTEATVKSIGEVAEKLINAAKTLTGK